MENFDSKEMYLNFPLCLLIETYEDSLSGWEQIIGFGIVALAQKFKFEINEVGRQIMYSYYRESDAIPRWLHREINQYVESNELEIDEDYNGFTGDNFEPFSAVGSELFELFECDRKLKEQAILFYQVRQLLKLGILPDSIESPKQVLEWRDRAIQFVERFETRFGTDVMVGIKLELIIQAKNKKIDRDLFRAYTGVKSLIGKKKYTLATKPAILSRMLGCKSKEAFEFYTKEKWFKQKSLLPTLKKYSQRYHMDKLLLRLAEGKFVMFLSRKQLSSIYLSTFMEPEELSKIISETKPLKQRISDAATGI